jgi:hypothetical protein
MKRGDLNKSTYVFQLQERSPFSWRASGVPRGSEPRRGGRDEAQGRISPENTDPATRKAGERLVDMKSGFVYNYPTAFVI